MLIRTVERPKVYIPGYALYAVISGMFGPVGYMSGYTIEFGASSGLVERYADGLYQRVRECWVRVWICRRYAGMSGYVFGV